MGYALFIEEGHGAGVAEAYQATFGVPMSPRVVVDSTPRWRHQALAEARLRAEQGERDTRYALPFLEASPENGYQTRWEQVSTELSIPLAQLGEPTLESVRKAVTRAVKVPKNQEIVRLVAPGSDPSAEADSWSVTATSTKAVNTTARAVAVTRFLVTTDIPGTDHPANAHSTFESGFATLPEARSFVQSLTHDKPGDDAPDHIVCEIESRTRRADGSALAVVQRVAVKVTVTANVLIATVAALRPGAAPDGWFFTGWDIDDSVE
jgi:hypothetical protein